MMYVTCNKFCILYSVITLKRNALRLISQIKRSIIFEKFCEILNRLSQELGTVKKVWKENVGQKNLCVEKIL